MIIRIKYETDGLRTETRDKVFHEALFVWVYLMLNMKEFRGRVKE